MIFMTCSKVTPAFGESIASTPVILGCGGVDWPRAMGARTIANASSRYDISIFIFQLLGFLTEICVLFWYRWVPHTNLDAGEEKRLLRAKKLAKKRKGHGNSQRSWYYTVPASQGECDGYGIDVQTPPGRWR